jgi:hypothetical protein
MTSVFFGPPKKLSPPSPVMTLERLASARRYFGGKGVSITGVL